jgi:hypothetical protein
VSGKPHPKNFAGAAGGRLSRVTLADRPRIRAHNSPQ